MFWIRKTNVLLNLLNNEPDTYKLYLYAKDRYKAKHQLLLKKGENTWLNYFNDSKACIEYSNDMDNDYKNIEGNNPNKKRKILLEFNVIAEMLIYKKLNLTATELFIRDTKLDVSLDFMIQFYFAVPKNIRLNSTYYFVIKIQDKRELRQIVFNHSSDIEFHDFKNVDKNCSAKPYSFLVIDATVASDNSLGFRENLVERIKRQLMIRLKMKNCNMILTEKQQKYQHYHHEKLIKIAF